MFLFLKPYDFWFNKIHKHTPRTYPRLLVSRTGSILCQPSNKAAGENAVLQSVGETALNSTQDWKAALKSTGGGKQFCNFLWGGYELSEATPHTRSSISRHNLGMWYVYIVNINTKNCPIGRKSHFQRTGKSQHYLSKWIFSKLNLPHLLTLNYTKKLKRQYFCKRLLLLLK